MTTPAVTLGAERLLKDFSLVDGKRWGLITNYTGITSELELTSEALHDAGAPLVALLTPEHGLRGTAQAGLSEAGGTDPDTGLPVIDTYLKEGDALDDAIAKLEVDTLLCDLQDIGARYYTYSWTMVDCMRAAARLGIPFSALDRPNPLGGEKVTGPGVDPGFESFIGRLDIPIRHGLTMGEIARVGARLDRHKGIDVPDPHVVTMEGWQRSMLWAETGVPWVLPSPNMPTPDTAMAFIGSGVVEGTNMSEGRGTTRPFQIFGAPWLTKEFAKRLDGAGLPGVRFRRAWFQPTFGKNSGEVNCGAEMYVVDPEAYSPLETSVEILSAAMAAPGSRFEWLTPQWEDRGSRPPFIDLVWGSARLREALDAGDPASVIEQSDAAQRLRTRDADLLLY